MYFFLLSIYTIVDITTAFPDSGNASCSAKIILAYCIFFTFTCIFYTFSLHVVSGASNRVFIFHLSSILMISTTFPLRQWWWSISGWEPCRDAKPPGKLYGSEEMIILCVGLWGANISAVGNEQTVQSQRLNWCSLTWREITLRNSTHRICTVSFSASWFVSTLKISNWTFTYIYLLVLSLYWSMVLLCSLTGKISNTGSLAGRLTGRLAEKFLMRWVTEDHNVPLQKSSIIFIDHLRARQQWFWHEHPAKPPTMFSISLKDLFKNFLLSPLLFSFSPPCKIRKFQVQTWGGRVCVKFLPPGIPGVRGQTCLLNNIIDIWWMSTKDFPLQTSQSFIWLLK